MFPGSQISIHKDFQNQWQEETKTPLAPTIIFFKDISCFKKCMSRT